MNSRILSPGIPLSQPKSKLTKFLNRLTQRKPLSWAEQIAHFLHSQKVAGRRPLTIKCQRTTLEAAANFWAQKGLAGGGKLDSRAILDWLSSCHARGLAQSTLNSYLATVKTFCEHLVLIGQIEKSPVIGIPARKVKEPKVEALSRSEFDRLLAAADDGSWRGWKTRLLLTAFAQTGLRVHEMLLAKSYGVDSHEFGGLRMDDVRLVWSSTELHYTGKIEVTGKGGKVRTVPLSPDAAGCFHQWFEAREERFPDVIAPYVWLTESGKPLTKGAFYQTFRQIAAKAELPKSKRHPHILRHTCGTWLADAGVPILQIAQILGHSNTTTTMRYYVERNTDLLAQAVSRISNAESNGAEVKEMR